MFPQVEETIVAYDESARTLTYAGARLPVFVSQARNRWRVTAIGDNRARVSVDATMELRGAAGWLLAVPLRVWLTREGRKTRDDLKHFVEHGQRSQRKQRRLARGPARSRGECEIR